MAQMLPGPCKLDTTLQQFARAFVESSLQILEPQPQPKASV